MIAQALAPGLVAAQWGMDTTTIPTALLGGLSPAQFMRRHWQRKPLLVRQAVPGATPPLGRAALLALAENEDVESRLLDRSGGAWALREGPLPRRSLPPLTRPGWTLLVQGLDLHVEAARELLDRFRFVPDARLDDVMISYASDGGGVGPHFDSYDVFLLQVHGRRRWRIGRQRDRSILPGLPLKILASFEPEHDWVLEPGDLLYLPPGWAHDGAAVGNDCMTCSVGMRVPARDELARSVLQRALDETEAPGEDHLYRDAQQPATLEPGLIPPKLAAFALEAVARFVDDPQGLACALGEVLSEPKPRVCFDGAAQAKLSAGVRLDRRSRMLYDDERVYLNGESYRAGGRDARAMQRLADRRCLDAAAVARLSPDAVELLAEWVCAGWVHDEPDRA
jgi:50S ribosomal protein L16 3-hydroxylase